MARAFPAAAQRMEAGASAQRPSCLAGEKRGQLWGHGDSSQDVVREDVAGGAGNKPSGCLGLGEVARGGLEVERGPWECAAEWIGPEGRVSQRRAQHGADPSAASILRTTEQVSRTRRGQWPADVTGGCMVASLGRGTMVLMVGGGCGIEGQVGVGRAGSKSHGREEGTRLSLP